MGLFSSVLAPLAAQKAMSALRSRRGNTQPVAPTSSTSSTPSNLRVNQFANILPKNMTQSPNQELARGLGAEPQDTRITPMAKPAQVAAATVAPNPDAPRNTSSATITPQATGTMGEIERQNREAESRMALEAMRAPTTSPSTPRMTTPQTPPQAPQASKVNLPQYPGYSVSPEVQAARQAALAAMTPSERENALAQELAQFRGDTQQGILGLEGQGRGIPLGLIRGMQGKLAQQANIQEQTLMERLAAEQTQRQIAAQAAQAQLGFATQDMTGQQQSQLGQYQAQVQAMNPQNIGGNIVQYNPETGQYETVYQSPASAAEGFTLSPGQQRFDAMGNPIASVGQDQGVSPLDQARIDQIYAEMAKTTDPIERQLKQAQIDKIYTDISNAGTGKFTEAQNKAATYAARMTDAAKTLDALDKQFSSAFALGGVLPDYFKGEDRRMLEQAQRNFLNSVLRRESGAVISPSEFEEGRKQYFPQPGDTAAVQEQKKRNRDVALQGMTQEAGRANFSMPGDTVSPQTYQQMLQNGEITQEEYNAVTQSFTNDLSTSQNGSAQAIANAIKQVESGGNYNARGGSGESGAYQFMPSTWKGWATQYLGDANAPMTPENQDRVALAKIADLLKQGYGPREIALIWNGGTPQVKKGTNQYGVAYDSGAYANKVLGALQNLNA